MMGGMNSIRGIWCLQLAWVGAWLTSAGFAAGGEVWLTTPDRSALFQRQATSLQFAPGTNANPTIEIDGTRTCQTMAGFGFTLTGGSAQLLHRMGTAARAALLRELFATDGTNIGLSYLRISIGASDLNDRVFSYDDRPPGETDPTLAHFDLAPDRADLIPVLQEILQINPALEILGSPWSPPPWMKTSRSSKGGSLRSEFYGTYAQYFVKYLTGMRAAGIRVAAITVQNEPLNPNNNPSLLMTAAEQGAFIRNHLGPALRAAKLDTRILLYDHNADHPEYPLAILADAETRAYAAGSAFHLYGGRIEALSQVHEAYPDKGIYFTEQWIGAPGNLGGDLNWHTRNLIIGATRNWSRTVLEWNLAADARLAPHTPGGCDRCLGALTIEGDAVTRNPAYYIIAHASKFVRPGAIRVESTTPASLPNVAFKLPGGQWVVVVLNGGRAPQDFNLRLAGAQAEVHLPAGAVGTFVW